jgi:hypothetical protein
MYESSTCYVPHPTSTVASPTHGMRQCAGAQNAGTVWRTISSLRVDSRAAPIHHVISVYILGILGLLIGLLDLIGLIRLGRCVAALPQLGQDVHELSLRFLFLA